MQPFDMDKPLNDPMDEAVAWLVKLRGDHLSQEETLAFADWLAQDAAHAATFAKAEAFLDEMASAVNLPRPVENDATIIIPQTPQRAKSPVIDLKTRRRGWLAIPLTIAAAWLVAVSLVLPSQSSLMSDLFSDYHTQTGEIRDIPLADGSHLLLNTNTAVSVAYNDRQRLITLHHGQARFTVAKDENRPFEVKADALVVKALGTVFDVYKTKDSIKVTVQEHAVAARIESLPLTQAQHPSNQITVTAGEQLSYQGEAALPQPQAVELSETSAWQQHRLYIYDRPLSELIAELSRYRLGRIFLADVTLKNLRVTGVFPLDNPDEIIVSVRKVLGLQESRLGPWRVLHR